MCFGVFCTGYKAASADVVPHLGIRTEEHAVRSVDDTPVRRVGCVSYLNHYRQTRGCGEHIVDMIDMTFLLHFFDKLRGSKVYWNHCFCTPFADFGVWSQVLRNHRHHLLSPYGAMWQVNMVNYRFLFSIEKYYIHLPHCPIAVVMQAAARQNPRSGGIQATLWFSRRHPWDACV